MEEYLSQATKYAEKNPAIVGASALATLLTGFFLLRKPSMNRDVHDYDSQITGGLKILNNEDHTLKGKEFDESIKDYESMFAGSRKDTGAITTQESVEVRKARYAKMVDHFYNLAALTTLI